jgi:hypothetical protein
MKFYFRASDLKFAQFPAVFRLVVYLCLLATLPACEKDITKTVTIDTKPQLVVSAFISPQDTVLQVKVSRTQSVVGKHYSSEELAVQNATVKLSQGGKTILLTYKPRAGGGTYEAAPAALPIRAGQTYTLAVSTPDGHQVTATSTVPVTEGIVISDLNLVVKRTSQSGGQDYDEHTFTYKWKDAAGVENYYQTLVEKQTKDTRSNGWVHFQVYNNNDLFTDDRRDGQLLASSAKYTVYLGQTEPKPFFLHVYLAVTDRAYYLYHQSVKRQQETDGNPFAEPVLVYSNVKGGLGIFSAYNQLKGTLKVE